jgi:uncharacterized phage protein (TIGR02220 family)
MAASVRIEDEAFSDVRYIELAQYAGLADADHARGKMEHLWRQCTLEGVYELPAAVVSHYLGPNGVDAIVRARLGALSRGGRVRIRGTQGRIEWLNRLRENGKRGGRPKGSTKPKGSSVGSPSGYSSANPPAPAPAPAPAPMETGETETMSAGATAPSAAPRPRSRGKAKPPVLTPAEAETVAGVLDKLSRESGTPFRATTTAHQRVIAARLRDGVTEDELRAVILHCADPEPMGLGWRDNPKMRAFLRPETLFGPETIERYLPAARKMLAAMEASS